MKTVLNFSFVAVCLISANFASASDLKNGEKLYDANCQGCHDTRIHTRPNRIIHTYPDLANRVKFCDAQTSAGFDDAQLLDVTDFLNSKFYKFIKE